MANRERPNGIYIMLSDEEKEILNEKYELSACKSLRQFILKCILEKEVFVLDMTPFREMSSSIGRTTGSINQIAKRANQTGMIYKEDIDDLKILLEKQNKMIVEMRRKLFNSSVPSTNTLEKK
ncbi:MAG: plasmid mobilization relaxosome protein MobC [Epulopiscium sp.]|nr:plasmid mobilization relaxosome protein MobC [Candidatus Epulonipiscium sp.]